MHSNRKSLAEARASLGGDRAALLAAIDEAASTFKKPRMT